MKSNASAWSVDKRLRFSSYTIENKRPEGTEVGGALKYLVLALLNEESVLYWSTTMLTHDEHHETLSVALRGIIQLRFHSHQLRPLLLLEFLKD